jgi:hypothetical protein
LNASDGQRALANELDNVRAQLAALAQRARQEVSRVASAHVHDGWRRPGLSWPG